MMTTDPAGVAPVARIAFEHGDRILSMGYALETIANLLGCDGAEHLLSSTDRHGLTHCVRALAGYALGAGQALCEAAEMAGALQRPAARTTE
jgi:hypothetical protein